MNKMNRKILVFWAILFGIYLIGLNPLFTIAQSDSKTGTLTISSGAATNEYWEDTQWIFYVTQCPSEEQVIITLEYEGELNLDLVILVDETTAGDKILAWDITHCGWDSTQYPTTGYSAINTKDTAITGPETVVYTNLNVDTKAVYILVYAKEGVGTSDYTLTCSRSFNAVPSTSLQRCSTILQAWILFGIGCVIFSVVFLKIVKRAIMTPDQKAAEKMKKEEAKKKKDTQLKATGKAKSSMAARKSTR